MQNIMGGDTTTSSLALLQSTERTDKKTEKPAPKAGPNEEELRQLFDSIDTDGGGTLDREELAVLATKLGQALGPAELEAAMAEMDADGDGDVDFDEFQEWWCAAPARAPCRPAAEAAHPHDTVAVQVGDAWG
jgi:hypothetical protein